MSNKNKSRLIKRLITGAMCLTLVFSINGFASVVSDNDGSAFITKAEFDSLKNNFQSQIDQYNTSIDNKIDGAIAAYLSGITVAQTVELTPLPNSRFYANLRWLYSTVYEGTPISYNGKYSASYFRCGPKGTTAPIAGKNIGGVLTTCKNKVAQKSNDAITATRNSSGNWISFKYSTGAQYNGNYTMSGYYANGGFRNFESLFLLPVSAHAWTSWSTDTPIPSANRDVAAGLGWSNLAFGYGCVDAFRDWPYDFTGDTSQYVRSTKSGVRTTHPLTDYVWPGTTVVDSYGARRWVIYGYDLVSASTTYAASCGPSAIGNARATDFTFSADSSDLLVGNVQYQPTEIFGSDLLAPGDVTMRWKTTAAPLTNYLDVTNYGFIVKATAGASAGQITGYNNIQWTTIDTRSASAVPFLGAFYKSGTTERTGWGNFGQSNYLQVDNVFYQTSTTKFADRIFFNPDDLTGEAENLSTYLTQKGIYNGTPICIIPNDGTLQIKLPTKILKGTTTLKAWLTNGPIENTGILTQTTTGTGLVTNKYSIKESANTDKSKSITSSTSGVVTDMQIEVKKGDVVYLHILPTTNVAATEVASKISDIKLKLITES